MAFNSIDGHGPGNRHQRRIIAAIQRSEGKEPRKAAADARRERRKARNLSRDLGHTIVFYALPVYLQSPDGAYLSAVRDDGRRQIIIPGELKATVDHYVKATGIFLKTPMRLVSSTVLTMQQQERPFLSLIIEPGER